jgi:hypothetical protein
LVLPLPEDDSLQAQAAPLWAPLASAPPQGAELLGSEQGPGQALLRAALPAWAAPELAFGPQVRVVVSLPVFGLEVRIVVAEPVFGLRGGLRGQEPERPDALAAPGPEFEPALAALKAWGALAGFA